MRVCGDDQHHPDHRRLHHMRFDASEKRCSDAGYEHHFWLWIIEDDGSRVRHGWLDGEWPGNSGRHGTSETPHVSFDGCVSSFNCREQAWVMKNTQVRNSNLSPQILTSQGASGRQACCLDVRCGQIALNLSRAVVEQNLTSSEVREASTVLVDDPVRAIQTLPGMSAAGNKMGSRCPHLSLRERWGTRPRREPYK